MTRLDANLDDVLAVRARNGAQSNRLDAAEPPDQITETATTKQLSDTEDADFAQTHDRPQLPERGLPGGAARRRHIVQTSLMDFLK